MSQNDQSSVLKVGSWLFYICWLACLSVIVWILIWKIGSIQSPYGFFLFLVLLCMVMLPFLKSFAVGNIFSVQVRELTSSVEKLRDSVQNILIQQSQNTQNLNLTLLNAPDGRNVEIQTGFNSKKYSNLGNSLFQQGRYMESLDYYGKAFESDSNNWVAAMFLGYIYLSLNDLKKNQTKWGFNNRERLLRSVFYSMHATQKDPNHYMQFMNLGIALRHLGGKNLIRLGLENLEKAFNMLSNDPQIQKNPELMTAKGKCRSFMGEFVELLEMKKEALQYRKEAVEIFNDCPEPLPADFEHWLRDAERAISEIEKSDIH
jgi:tetratricopeptide (TPR) repeat protein